MAAISRRRRFVIFVLLCCLTYFLFSWYIKGEDIKNITSNYVTDDSTIVENTESKLLDYEDETKLASYKDFLVTTEETKSIHSETDEENDLHNTYDNAMRLQRLRLSKNRPSNLFSFDSHVTYDPELAFSGPTDYEDDSLYMKAFIHKAGSSSAPARASEVYQTQPYPNAGMDIELFSGPTEESLIITKAPTYPPQHPDSKGSPELKTTKEKSHMSTTSSGIMQATKPTKNPALIIDTSGCKIPKMDPFDPSVADLIKIREPWKCDTIPLFMTPEPHGVIHLNVSVLEQFYNSSIDDMQCWYQAIIRKHEAPGNVRENDYTTSNVTELKFDEPLKDEYIAAKCFFSNNSTFEQYLPLVQLKKEIEEERSKITPPSPLNVILLGIDSVSKLNFMRHFRRTKAYLSEKMKPFDMKGYTKVGDNTFPNLVPLLTGHFVEYYWNESIRDTFVFDNIDLIWKDYAKKGYRTFYAEDSPYTGTFNYIKRGFYDPPTDYYYRPLALAIEQSDLRKDHKDSPCLNSELETDLIYDYLKNFVKTMDKRPYIAFAMVSTLTHDFLNSASYADPPAVRILEELDKNGALNRSAVVLFSDHGLRFGAIRHTYIGKFEERMPFMYIHFPKWFLDQHPDFERNLHINQDRLITLFDVHAMMKHLLHLNGEPMKKTNEIGLSLLNEIPENRTCDDAWIFQHWCPCNSFDPVPVDDPAVVNNSQAVIDHINELLLPYADVCASLDVAEVTDARLGLPNIVVRLFERAENLVENRTVILGDEPPRLGDYLITLTAKPGGAIFEGTVRYDAATAQSKVLGISRINMYGNQSRCINSQKLKIYCFCKDSAPS